MAERLFERAAGGAHAVRSAGADPGAVVHPEVVEALREVGIDASGHTLHKLDDDDLAWADVAVAVCPYDVCPVTPGVRRISWAVDDPIGLPVEQVRRIRDEIEAPRRGARARALTTSEPARASTRRRSASG